MEGAGDNWDGVGREGREGEPAGSDEERGLEGVHDAGLEAGEGAVGVVDIEVLKISLEGEGTRLSTSGPVAEVEGVVVHPSQVVHRLLQGLVGDVRVSGRDVRHQGCPLSE